MMLLAITGHLEQVADLYRQYPALVVLGVLVIAVLAITSSLSTTTRLSLVGAGLFVASLERQNAPPWVGNLSPGLAYLSQYSRILTLCVLALLTVSALAVRRGHRFKIVFAVCYSLLALQLLNCVKMGTMGETNRALLSLVIFLMTFVALPYGIGKTLQTAEHVRWLLLAFLGSVVLIEVFTLFELMFNTSAVYAGSVKRLYATLGHPQKAGFYLALGVLTGGYFFLHWRKALWAKPLFLGITCLALVGVVASGSRTALLATMLGALPLFRAKFVGGIVFATIVVMGLFFALDNINDEGLSKTTQRITSTVNTRAGAFNDMVTQFVEHPIFGAPLAGSGGRSSSYFGVPARLGLIGLTILATFLGLAVRLAYKLNRARGAMHHEAPLADLVLGLMIAFAVAMMFDQYIFDTVSPFIMLIYLVLTMAIALTDLYERHPAPHQAPLDPSGRRTHPPGAGNVTPLL